MCYCCSLFCVIIGYSTCARYGKMDPSKKVVYVGDTATLACVANFDTFWYRRGEELSFHYVKKYYNQTTSEIIALLQLKNVTHQDSGKYTCAGWRTDDNDIKQWISVGFLYVAGNIKNN